MAIIREWQSIMDRGGAVRALLVNFQKAFDLVNHNLLSQKKLIRTSHIASSNGFSRTWIKRHNVYE